MALDNTSTYESWLIIDTYIEKLEKENEKLKNNWNELKGFLKERTMKSVFDREVTLKILSKMQELEEKEVK